MLRGAASDYRTLIYFGLFLDYDATADTSEDAVKLYGDLTTY